MIWLIAGVLYFAWIGLFLRFNHRAHRKKPTPKPSDDLLAPYERFLEFDLAARESEWRR